MMKEILVMDCLERETFWTTLRSDYKILFASTAEKGLNMLSENVELVFLSIDLPGMNSMEALRLIKKECPSTAVIIIASDGTEETCMGAFGTAAKDNVKKPLEAEEILHEIKVLLNAGDASQRHLPVSLSTKPVRDEHYPDVPPHIVEGVLRVRDFIAQNQSESLTLADACKMASMSKTYFCHFFKYITGHSLRSYHHVVKIRTAEELLKNKGLSIKDVAQKVGYSDANYFSTIYKKITGVSPKQRQTSDQNRHLST